MDLVALTYTSRAAPELAPADIDAIHLSALTYNPLDGITGLLLFNGLGFLQIIEGAESAIEDLVIRLKADPRHAEFEVRDRRTIKDRFFPHWSMYRLDIEPTNALAQIPKRVGQKLDDRMRSTIDQALGASASVGAAGD